MRKLALLLATSGLAFLLVVGCQSDGPSDPTAGLDDETEVVFKVVNGNNQSALPGEELPNALVAKLTDKNDNPRVNYVVNWVVVEGGGSVWAPATVTDDNGKTKNRWTLGPAEGANVVQVRSMAPSGKKRMHGTFRATGEPTPPPPECTPGETQQRACGNNGTQTRVCMADESWGDWGTCQDETPECTSGEVRPCGFTGEQTCTGGVWGVCVGDCGVGFCKIDGTCQAEGVQNPLNECEWCDPGLDLLIWTARTDGSACTAAPNATCVCLDAECTITSCDSGYDDCNGLKDDGCEIDLMSDVDNCGACGFACPTGPPGSVRACTQGVCESI